ncbi:MAG: 16S rRNA (cytosine(967)-C(5))-methyltransferase, partial [Lachnospiraceae bacterium]|nr:16S rRNA (cytosine(967)-C(5))-methyltransferase [Lachnospiraceae bacterium]
MTKTDTRELIVGTLLEVTSGKEFCHIALRQVLDKYQYMEKQQRAFLTRVTEGTLERMLELDYILDQFSKVPVRKMKPFIRNLLRMSVYQMKYMDRVPDAAVCNEAVKLARKK